MKKLLLSFLLLFLGSFVFSQSDSSLKWTFSSKKINKNLYEITAAATVPQGWHLYANNLSVDSLIAIKFSFDYSNADVENETEFNKVASTITEPLFNNKQLKVFTGDISVKQLVKIDGIIPPHLKGTLSSFIGKGDQFINADENFDVELQGVTTVSDDANRIKISTIDINHPLNTCGTKNDIAKNSLLYVFFLGFVGGFIALLTPCVFPMIPVTVSFFTKRSQNRKQAVSNGLLYGFFIFLIYALASVPFHLLPLPPEIFNSISTNPSLNIFFFAVFLLFAVSFFGFFEITLPNSIAGKADSKSNLGSIGGIFFMALTLVIVSFSCTGIILGTILGTTAQNGPWPLTFAMAGFGCALGLPFALFAVFPEWLKSLPKSGGWLDTVKKVLAFIELALAFKFLSNADLVMHWGLLKREVFIAIWIIVGAGLTLYLFGLLRLPHDEKGAKISTGRKILGILSLIFTLYLIPGVTSTKYANLQLLSGFPPPFNYSVYGADNARGKSLEANVINNYDSALQLAKMQHKPLLIDFTGWACVNCRKMEENVWSQPDVFNYIKENFILVSLYVDDRKPLPILQQSTYTTSDGAKKEIVDYGDKWSTFQTENFMQNTQPLYAIISNDEKLINNPVGYTPSANEYLKWLQCGKENFSLQK